MLYVFPIIGGVFGGDAVSAALYLNMRLSEKTVLAIDVGTNSEVMLSFGGNIYAASAAAGPAFEGSGISSGMRAGKGAIQGVAIDGDKVTLDVIGGGVGGPPKGICGSGLLSATGALLTAGAMEKSGRLETGLRSGNLANRIREDNRSEMALFRGASGEVALSQSDMVAPGFKGRHGAAVEVLMTNPARAGKR